MAIGYRHTKTYIAASFDHDRDAVEKLYECNLFRLATPKFWLRVK